MTKDKPRVLQRKTIAQTRIFHVEELDLEFSNGTRTRYERLVSSPNGAVLIVPIRNDDRVLLVREYAGGTERYELALPKGKVEQGETLLDAAQRELKEEVGYGAREIEQLASLSIAPGYVQHITHVLLARGLYPDKQPGDEPEPIQVVPWRLSDLDTLVERDDFTEARSLAALYLAKRHLEKKPR
jgi:ADP-ribose diphosphatase